MIKQGTTGRVAGDKSIVGLAGKTGGFQLEI